MSWGDWLTEESEVAICTNVSRLLKVVFMLSLGLIVIVQAQDILFKDQKEASQKELVIDLRISEEGRYVVGDLKFTKEELLVMLKKAYKKNLKTILRVTASDKKFVTELLYTAASAQIKRVTIVDFPEESVTKINPLGINQLVVGERFYISLFKHGSVGVNTKVKSGDDSIVSCVGQRFFYDKFLVSGEKRETGGDAGRTIYIFEAKKPGVTTIKTERVFRDRLERKGAIKIVVIDAEK